MNEWINCDDKLPTYEDRVLIGWRFSPEVVPRIGRRISTNKDGEQWQDDNYKELPKKPSHWMPLPERP